MTQHEKLLEEIISQLLIETSENEATIIVHKIRQGWTERLKSIYPQLCLKLGRKCEDILFDYLKSHPPRSWNVLFFGGDLPKFLRDSQSKREKYLHELADFEWSLYWVKNVPSVAVGTEAYMLNPFVRYLKFQFGIWAWWKEKKNLPEQKDELLIVSKAADGSPFVFEPNLMEATVIDLVSELTLSLDEIVNMVTSQLQGAQRIQVEVALDSLLSKGVIRGPSVPAPIG